MSFPTIHFQGRTVSFREGSRNSQPSGVSSTKSFPRWWWFETFLFLFLKFSPQFMWGRFPNLRSIFFITWVGEKPPSLNWSSRRQRAWELTEGTPSKSYLQTQLVNHESRVEKPRIRKKRGWQNYQVTTKKGGLREPVILRHSHMNIEFIVPGILQISSHGLRPCSLAGDISRCMKNCL